jgi:hypothetical protein
MRTCLKELDFDGPLFHPVRNNRTGTPEKPFDSRSIYRNIVVKYGCETGIHFDRTFDVHLTTQRKLFLTA